MNRYVKKVLSGKSVYEYPTFPAWLRAYVNELKLCEFCVHDCLRKLIDLEHIECLSKYSVNELLFMVGMKSTRENRLYMKAARDLL